MTYTMNPMQSGTRMREGHDVFAKVILPDLSQADLLEGSEIWEAPADGTEVRKGDKWLLVTKRNGATLSRPGWTAYIHKGSFICNNFKEAGVVVVPPVVSPAFPASFILTDPATGNRAEYVFVKVL